MKKAVFVLVLLAMTCCLLTAPVVLAGSCTYRSYGYSNYNYSSYYPSYKSSYGYSPGYGYSTYYGQSYYYPNSYYWGGGYYSGDYQYPSGYYYPGYYNYPSYPKTDSACSYHAPNYPVVPYFPKYEAAVLLARFPTYGVQAIQDPPDRGAYPPNNPGNGYGNGGSYGGYGTGNSNYGAGAGYSGSNAIMGKLDQIVSLVQTVSTDVAELKAWRITVETRLAGTGGTVPPPPGGTVPRNAPPVAPTAPPSPANSSSGSPPERGEDVMVAGPNIMHSRCAGCHDEKKVTSENAKVILFVTGPEGAELATRNGKNEITALPLKTLQKCKELVVSRMMPPKEDAHKKAVPPLTAKEQPVVTEFLNKVIAQASSAPTGPAVR